MTTEDETPALLIEGVGYRYGKRAALSGVSLTVPRGAVTALLGPNGAGKTTLFNLATGLFHARNGTIAICGHDIARSPREALSRLGVVFQSRALDASLTLGQNLAYQGALHGLAPGETRARGATLLDRLGLAEMAGRPVRALSGGQARRGEVAAALLHRPRLLLCDEATAGLDVAARRALVEDMHRLAAETGVGILWATHLVDEIEAADRVVVLHEGQVRATGTAAELAAGHDGDLAAAFLALTTRAAA